MTPTRYLTLSCTSLAAMTLMGLAACSNDDAPGEPKRVLTNISISIPLASLEVGQMITAVAVGLDQDGAPLTVGPVSWSSETPTIAAAHPTSGLVVGVSPGVTRVIATVDGKSGERTLTVAAAPAIRINEVQPRPGSPTGWIEFFNPTTSPVDMSDWTLVGNNFFGPEFRFAAGSVVQPNGFLVTEETALPFSLEAPDNLHLFSKFGVQVDGVNVGQQPTTTFGRCPDGTAAFVTTTAATKGTTNACP